MEQSFSSFLFHTLCAYIGGTGTGIFFSILWSQTKGKKNARAARIAAILLYLVLVAFIITAFFASVPRK